MDELSSVSLPSVHLPSLAVDDMTKTFKGKVHQVEGQDIGKVNIDSNVPNLIIVTLTSILDSPNEKEGFRRNGTCIFNNHIQVLQEYRFCEFWNLSCNILISYRVCSRVYAFGYSVCDYHYYHMAGSNYCS